jgi:alpha-mannosidase II
MIEFVQYGTRSRGDKSGAYLFLPDGPGKVRDVGRPLIRVIEGKIRSQVEVVTPWVKHIVTINSSPGVDGTGIRVENQIDLTSEGLNNKEISMRISSNIASGELKHISQSALQ